MRYVVVWGTVALAFAAGPWIGGIALVLGLLVNFVWGAVEESAQDKRKFAAGRARNTPRVVDELERATVLHRQQLGEAIAGRSARAEIGQGIRLEFRSGAFHVIAIPSDLLPVELSLVAAKLADILRLPAAARWGLKSAYNNDDDDEVRFELIDEDEERRRQERYAAQSRKLDERKATEGVCWYCGCIGAPEHLRGHPACGSCVTKASA